MNLPTTWRFETARAEINYNKLDGDDVNSRKALERIAEGELGLR